MIEKQMENEWRQNLMPEPERTCSRSKMMVKQKHQQLQQHSFVVYLANPQILSNLDACRPSVEKHGRFHSSNNVSSHHVCLYAVMCRAILIARPVGLFDRLVYSTDNFVWLVMVWLFCSFLEKNATRSTGENRRKIRSEAIQQILYKLGTRAGVNSNNFCYAACSTHPLCGWCCKNQCCNPETEARRFND